MLSSKRPRLKTVKQKNFSFKLNIKFKIFLNSQHPQDLRIELKT